MLGVGCFLEDLVMGIPENCRCIGFYTQLGVFLSEKSSTGLADSVRTSTDCDHQVEEHKNPLRLSNFGLMLVADWSRVFFGELHLCFWKLRCMFGVWI